MESKHRGDLEFEINMDRSEFCSKTYQLYESNENKIKTMTYVIFLRYFILF